MFLYVSKEVFDALKSFLTRPDVWVLRGAAQLLNDLRYLEWTIEPPKQEGQYWCYFPKAHEPLSCLPILLDANGNPWVDSDDRWQLQNVTRWLGPLPVPEPPSEGE